MVVPGTYDPYLVTLSILVAAFASYTALDLGAHVAAARGFARRVWLAAATPDVDVCEALCRDRNSYSRSISNADIELVSGRELLATSKMLLKRAGSKSKPAGCKIKRAERLDRR
jgi:hypothetical protein